MSEVFLLGVDRLGDEVAQKDVGEEKCLGPLKLGKVNLYKKT